MHPLHVQWIGFIVSPLSKPNCFYIFKAISIEIKSVQNRFVLSVNCDSLSSLPNKLMPLTPESQRNFMDIYSAYRINRKGNRGRPCLAPFNGLNQFVVYPLFNTVLSMFIQNVLIHRFMLLPKLKASKILIIKGHSQKNLQNFMVNLS